MGGAFTGFAEALSRMGEAMDEAGDSFEKLGEALPEWKPTKGEAVRPIEGLFIAGKVGRVGGFLEVDGAVLVMVEWPEGGWVNVSVDNLEPV